ncbi:MAG: hypothetical protein RBS86_04810 [Candidatus Moranbacteria bacterium]|jgi:hypothetical protein|nr:hypothetical protein [Candidatus Moranbacteria bacterium]
MAKFIRKNNDPSGVYHLAYKTGINADTGQPEIREEIKIEGRQIFNTDDKKLIEILKNDPEILEFDKNTKIEVKGE